MRAAAFGAGARGGDDKARCNEFVGSPVFLAERIDALERSDQSAGVSYDSSGLLHNAAKFRARRVRESDGSCGGTRWPARLRCVIAQSSSDSVREDYGFK